MTDRNRSCIAAFDPGRSGCHVGKGLPSLTNATVGAGHRQPFKAQISRVSLIYSRVQQNGGAHNGGTVLIFQLPSHATGCEVGFHLHSSISLCRQSTDRSHRTTTPTFRHRSFHPVVLRYRKVYRSLKVSAATALKATITSPGLQMQRFTAAGGKYRTRVDNVSPLCPARRRYTPTACRRAG